jgi:hypothetical protein
MSDTRINCFSCSARGPQCADCVMSLLLASDESAPAAPARGAVLALDELRALRSLAAESLVPPLRWAG